MKRYVLAACTSLLLASQAQADDAAPSTSTAAVNTVTGSVSVVNDYLYRGLSQTDRKPALQAGIEYDTPSGWYVGAWGSNISWLADASTSSRPISSSVETDFYAGYRGHFATDWSYDAGFYEYYYPGSYPHGGYTLPYTGEGYASLAWRGLSLKYNYAFTNLFGIYDSEHSAYVDLSYSYEFIPTWVINVHVGHQDVAHTPGYAYDDWKLGIAKNFKNGYWISLGYFDTDAKRYAYTNADGHYLGRATAILSLGKTF